MFRSAYVTYRATIVPLLAAIAFAAAAIAASRGVLAADQAASAEQKYFDTLAVMHAIPDAPYLRFDYRFAQVTSTMSDIEEDWHAVERTQDGHVRFTNDHGEERREGSGRSFGFIRPDFFLKPPVAASGQQFGIGTDVPYKVIGSTHATTHYTITDVSAEITADCPGATHLRLRPKAGGDPFYFNLRELWITPASGRICKAVAALNGTFLGHRFVAECTLDIAADTGLITRWSSAGVAHTGPFHARYKAEGSYAELTAHSTPPLEVPTPVPSRQQPPPIDAALAAKIDADVQALLSASHVQGATIAIAQGAKVVYTRSYGLRDLEKSLKADAHTHYEIGSITKQFTAAAILQLKEASKIDLDAPLATYLPSAPHAREVTIRQLLTHTSGLADFVDVSNFETLAGTPVSFDHVIAQVAEKPLAFAPGTSWSYSNTNYMLLGRIVEVLSGQRWEEYVKQHLFARAGMVESGTLADEARLPDMARGYVYAKGEVSPSKPIDESWAGAAGGIVTTVADLAKWSDALARGRIISGMNYQRLTTPQRLPDGSLTVYGFGMKIDTFEDQPRIWHDGNTSGFDGSNQVFPSQGVRIIVLTNTLDAGSSAIVERIYNDLFPAIAARR